MATTIKVEGVMINGKGRDNSNIYELTALVTENGVPLSDTEISLSLGKGKPFKTEKTSADGKVTISFFSKNTVPFDAVLESNGTKEVIEVNPKLLLKTTNLDIATDRRTCSHCNGKATCMEGSKFGKICSCGYCREKSGIKNLRIFATVPCAYCAGKGYHEPPPRPQEKRENNPGGKK